MPDSGTPEGYWEWEEMNEGQIGAMLGMLEGQLQAILQSSQQIREQLLPVGTAGGESKRG